MGCTNMAVTDLNIQSVQERGRGVPAYLQEVPEAQLGKAQAHNGLQEFQKGLQSSSLQKRRLHQQEDLRQDLHGDGRHVGFVDPAQGGQQVQCQLQQRKITPIKWPSCMCVCPMLMVTHA